MDKCGGREDRDVAGLVGAASGGDQLMSRHDAQTVLVAEVTSMRRSRTQRDPSLTLRVTTSRSVNDIF